MEAVTQRSVKLAQKWYAGSPVEEEKETLRRVQGLAKIIESALKEQDKLTRHAIAEELSVNAFESDAGAKILLESVAHNIAMNTSAL